MSDGPMNTLPLALSMLAFAAALHVRPAAAEGGPAAVSAGASYSSSRGGLGFAGFDAIDLFGAGLDIGLQYQAGADGKAVKLGVSKTFSLGTTRMGDDSALRLSFDGLRTDWDSQGYAATDHELEFAFAASPAADLTYDLRIFARQNDFSDFGSGVSPLIVAEGEKSDAIGLGARLEWSRLDDELLPHSGARFGADLAWATPAGDREWLSFSVSGGVAIPVSSALTLSVRADAGHVKGLNGQNVTFMDRAFLGSPSPRGFAPGGLGPRDVVSGSVNSPLGGNSYVTSSVELRYQTANSNLSVGAFVDSGSVWELDTVTGGASGTIDDSFQLRSAAGVSIYWQTKIGLMQLNLASPIQAETYDLEEEVSLGISTRF
jgi:outer membrane protein assembly factor BamA